MPEFIHCQRDSWMLLPTIVALHLRGRQLAKAGQATAGSAFRRALLEGAAWGCAVWIKPHSVVPAVFLWLFSARRFRGASSRRIARADFLGLLGGGAIVGGIGSAWLIVTGTWPYLWDVLLNWNPEYYKWTFQEMQGRVSNVIMYFAPWSLIHLASIPVAIAALIRARVWRWGPIDGLKSGRLDQALIAAFYLGWFAEAVFLQKVFHYAQAPVHLLALAVMAAHRWPAAQVFIVWCLVGGSLNEYRTSHEALREHLDAFSAAKPNTYQQVVPHHKLINREWRSVWRKCLTEGSGPELKDDLSFYHPPIFCTPTWTELDEVRKYLETLHLKDGELVCWNDSTHSLYLALNIRPGFRFMHVDTALDFRSKRPIIRQELIAARPKYVVSDILAVRTYYDFASTGRSLDLPAGFPCFCRDVFPWNQPIVFEAGRYAVHRIDNPIGEIRIPYPLKYDRP